MLLNTLNGQQFFESICYGSINLKQYCEEVNDLNVFPIPDGDTGTNMCHTIEGGVNQYKSPHDAPFSLQQVGKDISKGMLLCARGNSGVILSQIFRGICDGFKGYDEVNVNELADAFINGIHQAYSAVKNPVEGTILTVFREASEYAKERINADSTINDYFNLHLARARISLAQTIDLLPVLKENDVIDSGGAGYVYIVEGFIKYLNDEPPFGKDEKVEQDNAKSAQDLAALDLSAFSRNDILEFGYCTEFIMRLQTSKVDIDNLDIQEIIDDLEADDIKGESIVAFKDSDIVKVHVHTLEPGLVLHKMRKYGEFLTIKCENMALQHNQTFRAKKKEHLKYAVVVVSSGDAMAERFKELGADAIVNGGQTSNPSTQDFIDAYDTLDAEHIIVFPNNSNITLTAKQSASLYDKEGTDVTVVDCKFIPACYSALTMTDFTSDDLDTIVENYNDVCANALSGSVTRAIRDRHLNDIDIHDQDFIGLLDGDVVSASKDENECVMELLSNVPNIEDKAVVTIIYGKDSNEADAEKLIKLIEDKYYNIECALIQGGQDIYHYYLCIE